jgi:hypothetical protein
VARLDKYRDACPMVLASRVLVAIPIPYLFFVVTKASKIRSGSVGGFRLVTCSRLVGLHWLSGKDCALPFAEQNEFARGKDLGERMYPAVTSQGA